MDVAIIGTGNIGSRLARDLVAGEQPVIIAGSAIANADALVATLGPLATSATVDDAIRTADVIVFAVPLDVTTSLIARYADALGGKVVLDPSNPIRSDGMGGAVRTLPDGQTSGAIVASKVPKAARFAKVFGTLAAAWLEEWSRRTPDRAVLFYASDDDHATKVTEQLITAAGFDPVRAGGLDAIARIESFGDLHAVGGLNGRAVTRAEALLLVGDSSKSSASM